MPADANEPSIHESAADGLSANLTAQPWYRDGIRFECARCGNCCSGKPGRVWFDPNELVAMAKHLGMLPFEFVSQFTRELGGRRSLREIERENGEFDCVFLRRVGGRSECAIHPVKPQQCRSYPFWPENLTTPQAYAEATLRCEGARRASQDESARIYERDEIERMARETGPA